MNNKTNWLIAIGILLIGIGLLYLMGEVILEEGFRALGRLIN